MDIFSNNQLSQEHIRELNAHLQLDITEPVHVACSIAITEPAVSALLKYFDRTHRQCVIGEFPQGADELLDLLRGCCLDTDEKYYFDVSFTLNDATNVGWARVDLKTGYVNYFYFNHDIAIIVGFIGNVTKVGLKEGATLKLYLPFFDGISPFAPELRYTTINADWFFERESTIEHDIPKTNKLGLVDEVLGLITPETITEELWILHQQARELSTSPNTALVGYPDLSSRVKLLSQCIEHMLTAKDSK